MKGKRRRCRAGMVAGVVAGVVARSEMGLAHAGGREDKPEAGFRKRTYALISGLGCAGMKVTPLLRLPGARFTMTTVLRGMSSLSSSQKNLGK